MPSSPSPRMTWDIVLPDENATGRLAADIVLGRTPIVDPAPFRYERFIDGTRPLPTTGV